MHNHFTGHTRLIVFYETILKKFLKAMQTIKYYINGNTTKVSNSIRGQLSIYNEFWCLGGCVMRGNLI